MPRCAFWGPIIIILIIIIIIIIIFFIEQCDKSQLPVQGHKILKKK